jgi:hypothetical protein
MARMKDLVTPEGRLKDNRINCHDVYAYLKDFRPHTEIAITFSISQEEVLALIHYIVEHEEAVEANWQAFEADVAKGYTPEVQAKIDASRKKLEQRREAILQRKAQEAADAQGPVDGRPCGASHTLPHSTPAKG